MASMTNPAPTMIRKAQNTTATGGRSAGATSVRPGISPYGSWRRMRLPR